MNKRLQESKIDKNSKNADKRAEKKAENDKKKFEEAVQKGIDAALKRKAEGTVEEPTFTEQPQPKKARIKAIKNVRDHTKLGHLST